MIGNTSIDLSLKNIWRTWYEFKKGKRFTSELHLFQYNLERELSQLYHDLNSGTYQHGLYRKFIVSDNKRREISVAAIRNRVVHRLVYNYLVPIYDNSFIFDAWSCRVGKGLLAAIERTQKFLKANPNSYVWKGDVRKFFDSVDQNTLFKILGSKINDQQTLAILSQIIFSFSSISGQKIGMPIGNLTSQIFANIYLNQLDRYVKQKLNVKNYLRYGDDFILIANNLPQLQKNKNLIITFLKDELRLDINKKNNLIIKARSSLKFLGVKLWPGWRLLNSRNFGRIQQNLNTSNLSGYSGLISQHGSDDQRKCFDWKIYEEMSKMTNVSYLSL